MVDEGKKNDPLIDRWLTMANVVTVIRGLLTIPIAYMLLQPDGVEGNVLAALLFAVAAGTDGLDGYLARSRGEVSKLGALLDPVVDKLLSVVVLAILTWTSLLPAWMFWTLLGKELILLLGGMWFLQTGREVPSSRFLGKLATVILFVGMFDVIGQFIGIGGFVCALGVLVSVLAGLDYIWISFKNPR